MRDHHLWLRGQLAGLARRLHELDLVERAERVLRQCYQICLLEELVEVEQELREARRAAASMAHGPRLVDLLAAEERLHAGQLWHAALLRRSAEEEYACRRARRRYLARRIRLLRAGNQLRNSLRPKDFGASRALWQVGIE